MGLQELALELALAPLVPPVARKGWLQ